MDFQMQVRKTMNDVLNSYYKKDIEQLNERAQARNLEVKLDRAQNKTNEDLEK